MLKVAFALKTAVLAGNSDYLKTGFPIAGASYPKMHR